MPVTVAFALKVMVIGMSVPVVYAPFAVLEVTLVTDAGVMLNELEVVPVSPLEEADSV